MPTQKRRRSVCLFGLSADPPTGHGGHAGIVLALLQLEQQDSSLMVAKAPLFDEIRVLPVYRHTYAVSCVCVCRPETNDMVSLSYSEYGIFYIFTSCFLALRRNVIVSSRSSIACKCATQPLAKCPDESWFQTPNIVRGCRP
jgi:hypothetical protein